MKFYDMFGGIGGFRLGLEHASEDYECVGYCDNDRFTVKSYNQIFGENHEPTDAKQLQPEELPDFDLLCGGFPCQSFSIAGKRKAFEDTRGTLFFEIARIAEAKRPQVLLLENVKGLLSSDDGKTFATILKALDELGYYVEWQVLNSKHFGVPQNRERVFIIGHLGGEPRRKVFPLARENAGDSGQDGGEENMNHPAITEAIGRAGSSSEYLNSLKKVNRIASRYEGKQAGGVYDKGGIAPMVNYGKRGPMPHHIIDWHGHSDKEPVFTDISPTLRNESHGHQPKVMDKGLLNHENKLTLKDESNAVDKNYWKGVDKHGQRTHIIKNHRNREIRNHGNKSPTINKKQGGGQLPMVCKQVITPDFPEKDMNKKDRVGSEDGSMFTVDGTSIHGVAYQPIDDYNQNFTDVFGAVRQTNASEAPRNGVKLKQGARIRKLTPKECWRLQGFPDWTFEKAREVNSDTQLYKQAGNAVTVNVIKAIGSKIKERENE